MKSDALRLLIRAKLADGRLPRNTEPRVWGGPGKEETCAACDEIVTKDQFVIQATILDEPKRPFQLHAGCFHAWESERQAPQPGSA